MRFLIPPAGPLFNVFRHIHHVAIIDESEADVAQVKSFMRNVSKWLGHLVARWRGIGSSGDHQTQPKPRRAAAECSGCAPDDSGWSIFTRVLYEKSVMLAKGCGIYS